MNLADPEDALRAYRKVLCSTQDGEPVIYWWQGDVYSRIPGERDRLLFRLEGMSHRATATTPDAEGRYGFRMVSREVMLYLDPKRGEVMRTWENPWTNESVPVVQVANDPVNTNPIRAYGARGPFTFKGRFQSGRGMMTVGIPLFYDNPLGGDYQEYIGGQYHAIELFNFFFSEAELLDPAHSSIPGLNLSWSRVSPWLPWMKMGDRVGLLIFHAGGCHIPEWDALPDVLRHEVETRFPTYKTPPSLDDDRPDETTWINFKTYVDELRESQESQPDH